MTMHRRAFLIATGVVIAAPVFPDLLPIRPEMQSPGLLIPEATHAQPLDIRVETKSAEFNIDGWDLLKDSLTRRSSTSTANPVTSDEVLIKVNQTWRTAWR
jgi:hypothetical protein